jgi:hypothetical protein
VSETAIETLKYNIEHDIYGQEYVKNKYAPEWAK